MIGHFTQMVWTASTKVGYGVAIADSPKWGKYGSKIVFVVAKYSPPGNSDTYTKFVQPAVGKWCCIKISVNLFLPHHNILALL